MRELFKAIGEDKPDPIDGEEVEPHRPTIH
jgi:hypothetical protein